MNDEKERVAQEHLEKVIQRGINKELNRQQARYFTELQKHIVIESIEGSNKNLEYYLKFMEIVRDEEYFRLWHIDKLGLDYDILIFLSKKGIGKSKHMIDMANEWVGDGKGSICLMRVIYDDVKLGLTRQLREYGAHFTIDGKGNLVHLYQTEEDQDRPGKEKPRICGMATSLKTVFKHKGGGFQECRAVIFDEATDIRDGIKKEDWDDLFVSAMNSIEREKTKMPMIIFGNTDSKVTAHPLFESLQIDPDENLVYIVRQFESAKNPTKILYINSRGLYTKGAQHSKFIGAIGDPHRAIRSFINEAITTTSKITALDLTLLANPSIAIVWNLTDGTTKLCKMARYEYFDPKVNVRRKWYFIKIENYDPMYCEGYKTFTDDKVLYSLYDYCVKYIEEIQEYWNIFFTVIGSGKCTFIGLETPQILSKYRKQFLRDLKTF